MFHEIFLKYFIEYLFSVHHIVSILNCMIFYIVYYANCTCSGVLDWHIHCARVWYEIIKICWAQPWLSFGIVQALRWIWECIRYFFWLIQNFVWNLVICTISLFNFGWWYTLMKNKYEISLYLGLKKMTNILQITFSNGFSLKKYCLSFCLSLCLSVCLCLSHLFHYVPIMVSSWNFQEWLPMTEVMSMKKFKVRGQKSRLQRSRPKLAISGP